MRAFVAITLGAGLGAYLGALVSPVVAGVMAFAGVVIAAGLTPRPEDP